MPHQVRFTFFLLIFCITTLYTSCGETEPDYALTPPGINDVFSYADPEIEISVDGISSTTADVSAKIISLGHNAVNSWEENEVSYGFLWFPIEYDENGNVIEQSELPTEIHLGKVDKDGQIVFSHQINKLKPNTEYTVCAFIGDENNMYPTGETSLVTDL